MHSDTMLLNFFSRSTAEEVVGWLCSDVGMSANDISRLFRRYPSVFCQRASRLSGVLEYLLDRLRIDRDKSVFVLLNCMHPGEVSQDALERRVADLEQYGE